MEKGHELRRAVDVSSLWCSVPRAQGESAELTREG